MQTYGSSADKLKRQSFFAIVFSFLAIIFTLLTPSLVFAKDLPRASEYIYEYALELYRRGDISEDVLHELRKALIADPNSIKAKYVLRKLSPKGLLIASTKANHLISSQDRVCPIEEIIFNAPETFNYGWQRLFYTWDFGDGMIRQDRSTAVHSYVKGGRYTVKVNIDSQPNSKSPLEIREFQVWVNSLPIVNMGENVVCCPNTDSLFNGSASYDPDGDTLTYLWDFGDGKTAEGQQVTHRYAKPGEFKVTLTVKDSSGLPCNTTMDSYIAVVKYQPIAVINIDKK